MIKEQEDLIIKQILSIRDTGKTNMFDAYTVKLLAKDMGYQELVHFIEENPKKYVNLILTGGKGNE